MNFSIDSYSLAEALQIVGKGLPSKNVYPILNNIKIDVLNDKLILTTSDGDIVITYELKSLNLKVYETGSFIIQSKIIEIIKSIEPGDLRISVVDDNKVSIIGHNYDCLLNMENVENYPKVEIINPELKNSIDSYVLKQLIRETIFFTAVGSKRPVLQGINFVYGNSKLIVSTTDSHRLAKKEINIDTINDEFNIIVPSKPLGDLQKIIESNTKCEVKFGIYDNKILFEINDIKFQSRLIEGAFPQVEKIIPSDDKITVRLKFNKEDLIKKLNSAGVLSTRPESQEETRKIARMIYQSNNVTIESSNRDYGKSTLSLQLTSDPVGQPISLLFSLNDLIDPLKVINSSEIVILIVNETRPFVFKPVDDDSLLYISMPIIYSE
jgi:DNA polymerase-3 subunit beta